MQICPVLQAKQETEIWVKIEKGIEAIVAEKNAEFAELARKAGQENQEEPIAYKLHIKTENLMYYKDRRGHFLMFSPKIEEEGYIIATEGKSKPPNPLYIVSVYDAGKQAQSASDKNIIIPEIIRFKNFWVRGRASFFSQQLRDSEKIDAYLSKNIWDG